VIDIFTCITAGYDDLKKQPVARGVRYTAFVEGVTLPRPPWTRLPVTSDPSAEPTRRSRQMKVLAHESCPQAEYSLWIDGCFRIEQSFFTVALPRWLALMTAAGGPELLTFKHTEHDCTYEHATRILEVGTDSARVVEAQMRRYRSAGLPEHAGMVQTNVILRKHTPAVEGFNKRWWEEIKQGSRRDQLSFIYAAREQQLRYIALPPEERQYFKGMSHRGTRTVVT
jgi:Protein of unknown function (DUF616)